MPDGTPDLRVASVNIASGRDGVGRAASAEALAVAVAGLGADVVSVQEVDVGQSRSGDTDQPAVLAAAIGARDWRFAATVAGTPGAAWVPVDPRQLRGPTDLAAGPRYGIALVSRVPVRRWRVLGLVAGRARLPVPDPATGRIRWIPDEPRAAVAAELDGLTVVATHLSFAPLTAARQLQRIRAWSRRLPGPVLVAGDLNLVGELPALITGGVRLVQARTYPAVLPRMQLDHLLALGDLDARDAEARALGVGDHLAVAATV